MDKNIVISIKTVLITLLLGISAYVCYKLAPVFGILLVALVITLALEPFVSKLANRKIRREFAVYIVYLFFVVFFGALVVLVAPPLVVQLQKFIVSIPYIIENIGALSSFGISYSSVTPQITNLASNVFNITFSFFSSMMAVVSVIFISLYMSVDWLNIKGRILSLFSGPLKEDISTLFTDLERTISHWIKGQLILMFIIGSATFVGLAAIDVPFALALTLIAGLLEIVPIFGPVISAVVASVVAFGESPVKGLAVVALFVVIQQVENNVLVPRVMQKVSGFSPLVILVAVLTGTKFFGIPGAILAVPLTMVGILVTKRFLILATKD